MSLHICLIVSLVYVAEIELLGQWNCLLKNCIIFYLNQHCLRMSVLSRADHLLLFYFFFKSLIGKKQFIDFSLFYCLMRLNIFRSQFYKIHFVNCLSRGTVNFCELWRVQYVFSVLHCSCCWLSALCTVSKGVHLQLTNISRRDAKSCTYSRNYSK